VRVSASERGMTPGWRKKQHAGPPNKTHIGRQQALCPQGRLVGVDAHEDEGGQALNGQLGEGERERERERERRAGDDGRILLL
jgi:hypothetical protein